MPSGIPIVGGLMEKGGLVRCFRVFFLPLYLQRNKEENVPLLAVKLY